MSLRGLYTLVGGAWGLLLGVYAWLGVTAFGLGISYLFVFGDDPWPETAGRVPLALGLAAGLVALGACLLAGRALAPREAGRPAGELRAFRRRGHILLALPVLLAAVSIAALQQRIAEDSAERRSQTRQEEAFAALLKGSHGIEGIDMTDWESGRATATLSLSGSREGEYRLVWTVADGIYRETLDQGERVVRLASGSGQVRIDLDLEALKANYRDRILKGPGRVLVEESFRFEAVLEPRLDPAERRALPARELHNLEIGQTALIRRATTDLPVRFLLEKAAD